MGKSRKPQRHVPERTCIACRTVRPKRALIRLVCLPAAETVIVDETGKRNGRGAYLCRQRSCWELAMRRHLLERALRVSLTPETITALLTYAQTLPETITDLETSTPVVELAGEVSSS